MINRMMNNGEIVPIKSKVYLVSLPINTMYTSKGMACPSFYAFKEGKEWVGIERVSGAAIAYGKTKKQLIENLQRKMATREPENFIAAIINCVRQYGQANPEMLVTNEVQS
jgi:hypothetical protein